MYLECQLAARRRDFDGAIGSRRAGKTIFGTVGWWLSTITSFSLPANGLSFANLTSSLISCSAAALRISDLEIALRTSEAIVVAFRGFARARPREIRVAITSGLRLGEVESKSIGKSSSQWCLDCALQRKNEVFGNRLRLTRKECSKSATLIQIASPGTQDDDVRTGGGS